MKDITFSGDPYKKTKQKSPKLKLTIGNFPKVQFGYTILGTRLDILNNMEIWDGKYDKKEAKKHGKCEGSADGIWFQDRRGNINQSSTWSRAVNRAFANVGKSLIHRRCLKYLRDLEKGGFVACRDCRSTSMRCDVKASTLYCRRCGRVSRLQPNGKGEPCGCTMQ